MLRGLATSILLCISLAVWGTAVLLGGAVKLFTRGEARRKVILVMARFGEQFVAWNNRILDFMTGTRWDIQGVEGLRYDGHYLILSNHVSWVDIVALFRAFHRKAAFPRFFLKQQLIWFPLLGQACWALDFPFMKRYSPEYLERHPEKRGEDLETTRRACRRYRRVPVSILNFLEGTRYTEEKRADQEAPYRHLLRPRVGGISFVLASLGEQLDAVYDVTIAYPGGDTTFWDLVTNHVPRITVRARRLDVPRELTTEAVTRPGPEREALKNWIETIWREKDDLLATLL